MDPTFELDFAARVDRGIVRESNQDVARVVPRLGLALVADGVGAYAHSGAASLMAAEVVEGTFSRSGGPSPGSSDTAERLQLSFQEVNERIADSMRTDPAVRMATTLVAAVFAGSQVAIGNVGDSRCYRLRRGTFQALTRDHSSSPAIADPDYTSSRGRPRSQRSLTLCLDGRPGVVADTYNLRSEPGDIYLVCSDGLWGSVADRALARILSSARDSAEACERLVGAAWGGGGSDNIGVAVVRLVPLQLRASDPHWSDPAGAAATA